MVSFWAEALIRAKDLHAIVRERELIEKKFQAISVGYHELKHQIREIMRTLEASVLVNASDPLPRYLAEGTFAAQYFLNKEDLIPDTVPGVGLADDAILVRRVVVRHGRELVRKIFLHHVASHIPSRKLPEPAAPHPDCSKWNERSTSG